MSIAALSLNAGAANANAASGQQSAPVVPASPLAVLTQFIPTEVVAVFVPGITTITAAFHNTGHMPFTWKIFGIDLTTNQQAFLSWTWFYLCLLLAVVYYLVGYISSWRRNSGCAWPRLNQVMTVRHLATQRDAYCIVSLGVVRRAGRRFAAAGQRRGHRCSTYGCGARTRRGTTVRLDKSDDHAVTRSLDARDEGIGIDAQRTDRFDIVIVSDARVSPPKGIYDALTCARRFVIPDMVLDLGATRWGGFRATIALITAAQTAKNSEASSAHAKFIAAAAHMRTLARYTQVGNRATRDCAMMEVGIWCDPNGDGSDILSST